MSDTTQTNAMAEIALALAMAFFSIMVLTMVSMGSGMVVEAVSKSATFQDDPVSLAQTSEGQTSQQSGSATQVEPENLIIFYKGRYFNDHLKAVEPLDVRRDENMVLAVSPDLSMSQALKARKGLSVSDMTVVVLDEKWLRAIEEAGL